MKMTFFVRRCFVLLSWWCVALLVAGAGAISARAQSINGAADVSRFPDLKQLPGKAPPRVWSGLAGVWARDHARWKATASNEVGAVVFLGDSITEGWSTLARDFPQLKVANRGIGGDITSGVLYRLKADVLSLDPAAIVLLIGTNDVGDGSDADDVAGNIRLILRAMHNFNPKLKVIVCKILPRTDGNAPAYAEKIKKTNALIERVVKKEPGVTLCDTWSAFTDKEGHQKGEDFRLDHLHLNAAGYAVWKSALEPVMANLHLAAGRAE
jgi:lysophospholipase L1-like esterase